MFWKAIWDKLPECIFENFDTARVKRGWVGDCEGDLFQKLSEPNVITGKSH